jgi:hypothetical protein
MMDRRSFFRALAGAAALPIVAKLPGPARRAIERVGAYARIRIEGGIIAGVTITSSGVGYTTPPVVTITDNGAFFEPPQQEATDA